MACARLGIKVLHAKPRAAESKGKIERYHQTVDRFINELRIDHVNSLEELNQRWKYFLEGDYQKKAHKGIAEYYKAMGVDVPEGGITPEQEWNRDEKALKFLDVSTVSEAFMHHETRIIDKAGCFSFEGKTYEASTALIGAEVEIIYDPIDTRSIKVRYRDMVPIEAKPVEIGAYAAKKPPIPVSMTAKLICPFCSSWVTFRVIWPLLVNLTEFCNRFLKIFTTLLVFVLIRQMSGTSF
jgi:hypothetical protein